MKQIARLAAGVGSAISANLLMVKFAAAQVSSVPTPFQTPASSFSLGNVLKAVINTILYIAGFIAVVYLVYNGIQYITSAGDTEKAGKAKSGIINAVIGILVIALAIAIARYLGATAAQQVGSGVVPQ